MLLALSPVAVTKAESGAGLEAVNAGAMTIGAPDGAQAQRESLPYDVPAPVTPRGRVGA